MASTVTFSATDWTLPWPLKVALPCPFGAIKISWLAASVIVIDPELVPLLVFKTKFSVYASIAIGIATLAIPFLSDTIMEIFK